MKKKPEFKIQNITHPFTPLADYSDPLLRELVAHLRENRTPLREEWARRITDTQLLTAMTKEEIFSEATSVYDNYVEVLETGSVEALQAYARNLSERIIPRGVETHEVVGIVLLLRDVLARSLFKKFQGDFDLLNEVLDAYEPAANRIANTVAVSFVQERERVIRQQQEAIRELSTPVLQVRERLLILPIIGVIDAQRARQLTEQLLRGIRANRAKVVVVDISGVPTIDHAVANHLVKTVEASRLMGASVIITGLSAEIAQTLVTIGVDLSKMNAVGDLQGGIEKAELLLGYKVIIAVNEPAGSKSGKEPKARVMPVPILKQGGYSIASIQSVLSDSDLVELRDSLGERAGTYRARGVIIDVTVLDVIDSFATRTLPMVFATDGVREDFAERVQPGEALPTLVERIDNGCAFPVSQIGNGSGRQPLGLPGMQERVRLVDGQFAIESVPKRGTTVRIQIPITSWAVGSARPVEAAALSASN